MLQMGLRAKRIGVAYHRLPIPGLKFICHSGVLNLGSR